MLLTSTVELQLATAMRPGELVVMRGVDIDMTGKIWLYRPGSDQGQEFGIDFARATLGHKSPSITEVYVERDQTISQQVMAKLG